MRNKAAPVLILVLLLGCLAFQIMESGGEFVCFNNDIAHAEAGLPYIDPSADFEKKHTWNSGYSGGNRNAEVNQYLGKVYMTRPFESEQWTAFATGYAGDGSGKCFMVLKSVTGVMCYGEGKIDLEKWTFEGFLTDAAGRYGRFAGNISQKGIVCGWTCGPLSGELESSALPSKAGDGGRKGIYSGTIQAAKKGRVDFIMGSGSMALGLVRFKNGETGCFFGKTDNSGKIRAVVYGRNVNGIAIGNYRGTGFSGYWGTPKDRNKVIFGHGFR